MTHNLNLFNKGNQEEAIMTLVRRLEQDERERAFHTRYTRLWTDLYVDVFHKP